MKKVLLIASLLLASVTFLTSCEKDEMPSTVNQDAYTLLKVDSVRTNKVVKTIYGLLGERGAINGNIPRITFSTLDSVGKKVLLRTYTSVNLNDQNPLNTKLVGAVGINKSVVYSFNHSLTLKEIGTGDKKTKITTVIIDMYDATKIVQTFNVRSDEWGN